MQRDFKFSIICMLGFAILILAGCGENYNPSTQEQASDRILGTWEVYGASYSPTGEILESEDVIEGWSGPKITFYSDKTFSTDGIWDSSSSGTWTTSGNTYYLDFSDGDTDRIIYQQGELYTDLSGMYFWLR